MNLKHILHKYGLDFQEFSGLEPSASLLFGDGVSAENVKNFWLHSGYVLGSNSSFSIIKFCETVLKQNQVDEFKVLSKNQLIYLFEFFVKKWSLFTDAQRESALRTIENNFAKIEIIRQVSTHKEEAIVLCERLEEVFGDQNHKKFWVDVAYAFEEFLWTQNYCDELSLIKKTSEFLKDLNSKTKFKFKKVLFFHTDVLESRYQYFLDCLKYHLDVFILNDSSLQDFLHFEENAKKHEIKIYHSIDDAALSLGKIASSNLKNNIKTYVIFDDNLEQRRALKAAFQKEKVFLDDPRNPRLFIENEKFKILINLLQFAVEPEDPKKILYFVNYFFKKSFRLDSYLENIEKKKTNNNDWIYSLDPDLVDVLKKFILPKKEITAQLLYEVLLQWNQLVLKSNAVVEDILNFWLEEVSVLDQSLFPKNWINSLLRTQKQHAPKPAILKNSNGVSLVRASQLPFIDFEEFSDAVLIWFYPKSLDLIWGFDFQFIDSIERHLLCQDFLIKTRNSEFQKRLNLKKIWSSVQIKQLRMYYHYEWNGQENLLPEECTSIKTEFLSPQRRKSFQLSELEISNLFNKKILKDTISITDLESYSRCSIKYLIKKVWSLNSSNEWKYTPFPHIKGKILHRCVEKIMKRYQPLNVEEILNEAISEFELDGMIVSRFLKKRFFYECIQILDGFQKQELEYQKRSKAQVFALEPEKMLKHYFSESKMTVQGRVDRIDKDFENNWIIIDYKTATNQPTAKDILSFGVGIQLPFYSIALRNETSLDVAGAFWIELTMNPSRSRGILFKNKNGKDEFKVSNSRSRNSILAEASSDLFWKEFETKIDSILLNWKNGQFFANPWDESECRYCHYQASCGKNRMKQKGVFSVSTN